MKKSLLFGLVSLTVLGLASCEKQGENSSTATLNVGSYNLFTPVVAGTGTPYVSSVIYSFTMQYPANTVAMTAAAMPIPGGATASFGTVAMPMNGQLIDVDNATREAISFSAANASVSGAEVTNLKGLLTQAVYTPVNYTDSDYVPGYLWYIPTNYFYFPFVQYTLGDEWNVRTFWADLTYSGQTVITSPMSTEPYMNQGPRYRVFMTRNDKGVLTGKADLIIYNAQFADAMPVLKVMLVKGLDVTFTDAGYTLSGKDIVAEYKGDGGEMMPYERFPFNEINATVGGDMTGISMSYQVGGMFNGTFNGSCIKTQ